MDCTAEHARLSKQQHVHDRRLRILRSLSADEWRRCWDVGGYNGSWHSNDLRALVERGFVEVRRPSVGRVVSKPNLDYRLTAKGGEYVEKTKQSGAKR